MEWVKILLLMCSSIGLWVSANLLFYRTGNRQANRLLMAFVLVMLLPGINLYSQLAIENFSGLQILATNLTWLYGPFLLAFIHCIRGQKISTPMLLLQTLPFFLALLWRMAAWPLDAMLFTALLFTQVFVYIGLAARQLYIHRAHILLNRHSAISHYWLLYLVLGLTVVMFIDLAVVVCLNSGLAVNQNYWIAMVLLVSLYVQGISLFSLYRPTVFFNECLARAVQIKNTVVAIKPPLKNTAGELTETVAQFLAQQLESIMTLQQPYLDNDLSLAKLAEQLGISSHQLSELLNNHLHCSFYDYVNSFRVQEAMALLNQAGNTMMILDIAFEAGFNNKNTFYRLFKQHTGLTPAQFRKNQTAAGLEFTAQARNA